MTEYDEAALSLVYEAIDALNIELPATLQLAKSPETELLGGGSYLDSLQLITFLVFLDDLIAGRIDRAEKLAEDALLLEEAGPLHSVGTLTTYLARQLFSKAG